MQEKEVTIINKLGLHARAAAKLVNVATKYSSLIEIEKDGQRVNGKSIMGVMMLAANQGSSIKLLAEGEDAQQSIDDMEQLINNCFDEEQ
ncbi:MAG: HPr family phosphocarrier protein [Gammaproteobacteria bacterium]|nr:HPr family phosphocarrier protein [Gammaproteobacteria bacterium]